MGDILNILGVVNGRPAGPREAKKDRSRSKSKSWSKSRGHKGGRRA